MALTTNCRLAAAALAAGLVAAPAAFAEQAPTAMQLAQDEQQQPAQPAIQPDEQQLDSFVVATVRIIGIQQQAQQQMQAAKPEQQEQVRAQALQAIVAAVENEGLSVDEYNGIVQHVENDPELGQTVQQRIQEEVGQ
jgi:predicted RNA-binding protein (virulence factor B family)